MISKTNPTRDLNPQPLSTKALLWVLGVGGVLLVTIGASLGEWGSNQFNYQRVLSTVIVGIGGSLVASVFVGIGHQYWNNIGKQKKQKALLNLLSTEDINQKTAIIIPRFLKQNTTPSSPVADDKPDQSKCKYAIKDSRLIHKYSLAFDDIVAARHISSVFEETGLAFPRLEFSDDLWNAIYNKDTTKPKANFPEYSAFICIGLFSNEITMELANSDSKSRLFRLSDAATVRSGKRQVRIMPDEPDESDESKDPNHNWDQEIDVDMNADPAILERQNDFALIAKCKLPDGRAVIIIGGAKSRATRKAASYFRKNWQQIHNHACNNPSSNLAHTELQRKLFAAAYSLNGKKNSVLKRISITIDQSS